MNTIPRFTFLAANGEDSILVALVVGGIAFLIFVVINATKRKVSEQKLKADPYNIEALENAAIREISKGNANTAMDLLEKILRIDNNNFLANLYLAVLYHKDKEYSKSKPLLKNFVENIEITPRLMAEHQENLGLLWYCMGHIYFMDGKKKKAKEFKKDAKKMDKEVLDNNWY